MCSSLSVNCRSRRGVAAPALFAAIAVPPWVPWMSKIRHPSAPAPEVCYERSRNTHSPSPSCAVLVGAGEITSTGSGLSHLQRCGFLVRRRGGIIRFCLAGVKPAAGLVGSDTAAVK